MNCASSTQLTSSLLEPTERYHGVSNEDAERLRGKWKVFFSIFTFTVFIALLAKLPLFLARAVVPHLFLPLLCPTNNVSRSEIGQERIFTMVISSILYIGRFVECLILQIHIYKFFFWHCTLSEVCKFNKLCIRGLTRTKWITFTFVVLSIYILVHSLSVPALGITLELKSGRESHCEPYVYEYHTVYWILDIIRYLYDVAVRLFMVLATMAVGVIWSEEVKSSADSCVGPKLPVTYKTYLEDREIANKDHSVRWQEYVERGKSVHRINEIFQTWFIIPWIIYFVGSSLSTELILKAWNEGRLSDKGQYNFSEVAYMVYNYNQLFMLALPYLCSKRMNTHHSNYVFKSRKNQVKVHKSASRMAFAYLNKIEQEDNFNFIPRIWGTSIKIQVENPLYVIFLLVGIFFTVCDALLQ